MVHSNIKISSFTGSSIKNYLSSIARLRTEVFRDYPYLYEADMQNEIQYLKKFANCKDAVAVIVFDGSEVVGASLGIPLELENENVKKAFKERELDLGSIYYFAESALLKKYRGRGIGHHFFDEREAHVQKLKKFKQICFCCVIRPENDPRQPDDYIPLDDFWRKRGYVKNSEMVFSMSWKDIGKKEKQEKTFAFWMKDLRPAKKSEQESLSSRRKDSQLI
jgi:GNAT superfamily N-acetyltransferase